MKKFFTCWLFIAIYFQLQAQTIVLLSEKKGVSFRGLSIKNNAIWVSGSAGTVGRTVDGGLTWNWFNVPGYEKNDFRDIEAFDERTAIIMAIASPGYILKTTNGGESWNKVYENNHPGIFLDAMAFKNKDEGIVIGDPINDTIFVARTTNGGNTWHPTSVLQLPPARKGEAFFAASGSNIIWDGKRYCLVSGGMASRFLTARTAISLPTTQGQQMTGANGMAAYKQTILVASGNYENRSAGDSAFVISRDGGKTWQLPNTMPQGYTSAVCFTGKNTAVSCGLTGIYMSTDNGTNWTRISTESFNVCSYSEADRSVYFAGNNGRIGKLQL